MERPEVNEVPQTGVTEGEDTRALLANEAFGSQMESNRVADDTAASDIEQKADYISLQLDCAPQNWPPGATDLNLRLAMDSFSGNLRQLEGQDLEKYNRLLEEVADNTADSSHPFRLVLGEMNDKTGTYDNVEVLATKQGDCPVYRIVQPGDTLSAIAKQYVPPKMMDDPSVYMRSLAESNRIADPNKIFVGQAIDL